MILFVLLGEPKIALAEVGFHMHAGYSPLGQLVGENSTTDINTVFTSTAAEYRMPISSALTVGAGAAFNLSYLQFQREKMDYVGTYNSVGVSTAIFYTLASNYSLVLHAESLLLPKLTVKTNSETRVNDVTLKQSQLTTYQNGQGVLTRLAFIHSLDNGRSRKNLPVVFGLSVDLLKQPFSKSTVKTNVNLRNVGARNDVSNTGQYQMSYLGIGLRVSISL